jgi:predicted peptidase
MPGYSKSTHNRFDGLIWENGNINYIQDNFIKFTTNLLKNIKKQENADELYVVGKSSGATFSATIASESPNIINKAVLMAGRYNIPSEYRTKYNKTITGIAATSNIDKAKNTKFLLIVGSNDTKYDRLGATKSFYRILKNENIDAKLKIFEGLDHSLEYDDSVIEESANFLK